MNVAPFDFGRCPSVRRADAAATRAALPALAMLPPRWEVDLPPFSSAKVIVVGLDSRGRSCDARDEIVLPVARGLDAGRVVLESAFAARLVDAALGATGILSSVRALGPAERGLLVALLAPALDLIGWSLGLGPAPAIAGAGLPLVLRLEGAFGAGMLRLEMPNSMPGSLDHARTRAALLPVVAQVEIATTELDAAALSELQCGDALVFDGHPAAAYFSGGSAGGSWEGRLRVGAYLAPLSIDPRGTLVLTGDFQMIGTPPPRTVTIEKEGAMDASGPTEKASSAVLAAAPIEIVAELGRVTLRGDEVLGLAPGVVLTVAADRRQAIALRVGGQVWAEGELVDVDGQLGVRVTRMLARER